MSGIKPLDCIVVYKLKEAQLTIRLDLRIGWIFCRHGLIGGDEANRGVLLGSMDA